MQWLRRLLSRTPTAAPPREAPDDAQRPDDADAMIAAGRDAHARVRRTLYDLSAAEVAAAREAGSDA